ncbi:MAG: 1-acyl-sn-glycerol-3-phosphate acyltransferase [Candidatus Bipolaricaulota bacterium]|nr:1-acyl-sn-glycerol-3-phosphate acyltransferase [Candidatus Bipolaricaulota bacterium]
MRTWLADRIRDLLWALLAVLLWLLVKPLFRLRVSGREHLVRGGILVAPHRSYWDTVILGVACGPFRRITFLARHGLLKNPLLGPLVLLFAVPIDREAFGVDDFRRSVAAAKRARLVGIFPEGTTRPGARPKPGAVRFAELLGRPLIPVNLVPRGPYPPKRWGRIPVRFPRIEVRIGPPFTVDVLAADLPAGLSRSDRYRHLSERLMERVLGT